MKGTLLSWCGDFNGFEKVNEVPLKYDFESSLYSFHILDHPFGILKYK